MQLPTLTGNQIRLRGLKRSDAVSIQKYANDRQVSKWLPLMPCPYTLDDGRQFINKSQRAAREDDRYNFGIEWSETWEIIGGIGIRAINRHDLNAEVGYWVARRFWRRGVASEALHLILGFAFKELGLRRIWAVAHSANKGSCGVLTKAGFAREAVWREASRVTGKWEDVYSFGLLKREYKGR